MPPAEPRIPLTHAVALGLLQGPAELMPISSSAHTSLLPWLLRWRYASLEGAPRKSFELALHAGAGTALAACGASLRAGGRPRPEVIAAAVLPTALAGAALRGVVGRLLGGPRQLAAGLAAGAAAMALAERAPATRGVSEATVQDGLALAAAQTAALVPGVSRNGATLAAARARGFSREASHALSWHAGLPLMLGAGAAEGLSLSSQPGRADAPALAAGACAALASAAIAARALGPRLRRAGLVPFAAYRLALAAFVLARHGRSQ